MASRRVNDGAVAQARSDECIEPARAGALCECELQYQNAVFAGTGGVSPNNRRAGFVPAYKHLGTGEAVVSRFADGSPAPVHVLDGLPSDWITLRDESGLVSSVCDTVVAGFVRDGIFYTREAAARLVAEEAADAEEDGTAVSGCADTPSPRAL